MTWQYKNNSSAQNNNRISADSDTQNSIYTEKQLDGKYFFKLKTNFQINFFFKLIFSILAYKRQLNE